ncbi:hypothetical protein FA10DRAFT_258640 [Acaromyces ingoldii]|uniref:Cullin family profile domain-containing protein n=1 Tax=Acaromyces ingoldii TaxID=215250 RepID=A0A316YPL3_9BASI|nr:hypothetical protein FA10DRAFT_258640 [Acaromyces ingoldii]PWN91219.1 hypothetical protein FA10DRAFT_258640 [Acaromyces ingoldii]
MRRFVEACFRRPRDHSEGAQQCRDVLYQLGMGDLMYRFISQAAGNLVRSVVQAGPDQGRDYDEVADLARILIEYTCEAFPILDDWIRSKIMPLVVHWLAPWADIDRVLSLDAGLCPDAKLLHQVQSLLESLQEKMSVCLGRLRSKQLFDIVVDFPHSGPALEDLRRCIAVEADIKRAISRDLDGFLQARLLHPGASTKSILQVYTHLIRALRLADPSGVVLSHVIGPVRAYLRRRPDTVPIIVSSLLGQSQDFTLLSDMMRDPGQGSSAPAPTSADLSAMYDEEHPAHPADALVVDLSQQQHHHQHHHHHHNHHLYGGITQRSIMVPIDDPDWAPRPIDAGPDYRQSRKSDVIAMIISIFDDEAGFVEALERSTAEQIIKVENYDARNEYEINENLKRRFGDASLGKCDTIIKDVKKSQRYDRSIHDGHSQAQAQAQAGEGKEEQGALAALHPLIISRQFWPDLEEEGAAARNASASTMFAKMSQSAPPAAASSSSKASALAASLSLDAAPPGGARLKMPGQFLEAQERYVEKFKEVADMKTLRWMSARGRIRLELEMDDGRCIEEDVVPLQAAVLECVNNASDSGARPEEIARELECDARAVGEALAFWAAKGILGEVPGQAGMYRVFDGQALPS